jgi:hypothetical protein
MIGMALSGLAFRLDRETRKIGAQESPRPRPRQRASARLSFAQTRRSQGLDLRIRLA